MILFCYYKFQYLGKMNNLMTQYCSRHLKLIWHYIKGHENKHFLLKMNLKTVYIYKIITIINIKGEKKE